MKNSLAISMVLTILTLPIMVTAAPKASPRFVLHGAEAYDTKTKLTWARCSVGQTYEDEGICRGTAKKFYWGEAQAQGNKDWRVPTKEELISLTIQKRDLLPQMDEDAFPYSVEAANGHWASGQNDGWGWHTRIQGGYSYYGRQGKEAPLPVRLVRRTRTNFR